MVIRLLLCSLVALGVSTAAHLQTAPLVRVDSGELQGVVDDGVASFKGIPFAAPPVGDLRWRPPQPPAQWTGVRQAAEFGADCMQGRFGPPPAAGAPAPPAPSEDCLSLNVWRPASATPAAKLPVMVWISRGRVRGRLRRHARHRRGPSSPGRASSSSASTTAWAASASSRFPR